jgi:hypothetical protein
MDIPQWVYLIILDSCGDHFQLEGIMNEMAIGHLVTSLPMDNYK